MNWKKEIRLKGQKYSIQNSNMLIHNILNLSVFIILIYSLYYFSNLASSLNVLDILYSCLAFTFLFFSLFVIVVHEASHNMFLIHSNKKIQKFLNRLFAYPVAAISFQDYKLSWELGHVKHHKEPLESHDPQNCPKFCLQGKDLLYAIIQVLFIPGKAAQFQSSCILKKNHYDKGMALGVCAWIIIGIANYSFFNIWITLIQLVAINLTMVINLLKVSMEHSGSSLDESDFDLRSMSSFFIGRHLFLPFNISLHFEHHLVMNIPWYNLKRFHKEAKILVPRELSHKVYNFNTSEVLKKITGVKI
jgi:fatty acid desaturase